jgi:HAD superfamily hydrolase (TIGR01459 family)
VFDGIDVKLASEHDADFVVCTGLFNDLTDTPDDYRATLDLMLSRRLFMACANPDVVVEKGGRLIYCAGALADIYKADGGDVLYAGKPYAPIYDEALAQAARIRGAAVDRQRVMAIGDSVRTDYTGARDNGFGFLFITSGIHADEFGERDAPDAARVAALLAKNGAEPTGVMSKLRW